MIDNVSGWAASALAIALCVGCASAPEQDAEYHAPKIYRTGSNIPVKDYGAENIEVGGPEVINPINRPMSGAMAKKPGG